MDGQTHQLLKLLGNRQRYVLFVELARSGPLTHAELRERTGLKPTDVSKRLGELEDAGLVVRPESNRHPWELTLTRETSSALAAFAHLAAEIGRRRADADAALAEQLGQSGSDA